MKNTRWILVGLLALAVARPVLAGGPTVPDQTLADQIAQRLNNMGTLRGYDLDIQVFEGTVTLMGEVSSEAQKAEVLDIVRRHPDVARVQEMVSIAGVVQVGHHRLADEHSHPPMMGQGHHGDGVTDGVTDGVHRLGSHLQHLFHKGMDGLQNLELPHPGIGIQGSMHTGSRGPAYRPAPILPQFTQPVPPIYGNHPYPFIPSGWRKVDLKFKRGHWWLAFRSNNCFDGSWLHDFFDR